MKYTESIDGIKRVSIMCEIRICENDIKAVKEFLQAEGKPYNEKAIKRFIRSCTDFHLPASFWHHHGDNGE